MLLKIVEPEVVTIYEIDTSEFRYGRAYIASLEELDNVGNTNAAPYHRYGKILENDHAEHVQWAKFLRYGVLICVVMATHIDAGLSAYLMSDSGETIERIT